MRFSRSIQFLAIGVFLFSNMSVGSAQENGQSEQSVMQAAENCRSAGQFPQAERLLEEKIALDEQVNGPNSEQIAEDLDTLSDLLTEDKKYAQAEKALRRALVIFTSIDGPERATNPFYLSRLANLAAHQQRFAEAEQTYYQILALEATQDGVEHPETLDQLAEVYRLAKDYPQAESLYLQALGSKSSGTGSGQRLGDIERLGALYEEEGKFQQAEALYLNAVDVSQRVLARGNLVLIANLNDLASFYERQNRLDEADEYYKLALQQFDGIVRDDGLMDHNLAIVMSNYAETLRRENRTSQVEQYETRAKSMEDRRRQGRPVCEGRN
jgi:tetratricopeptide (TPR) repeat protein